MKISKISPLFNNKISNNSMPVSKNINSDSTSENPCRNSHDMPAFGSHFARIDNPAAAKVIFRDWMSDYSTIVAKLYTDEISEDQFVQGLRFLANKITKASENKGKDVAEKAKELFFSHRFDDIESVMTSLIKYDDEVVYDYFNIIEKSNDDVKKAFINDRSFETPVYDHCLNLNKLGSAEKYIDILKSMEDKKFVYETLTKVDEKGKTILFKTADANINFLSSKILDAIIESSGVNQTKHFRESGLSDFKALAEKGLNSLSLSYFARMIENVPDLALKVDFPRSITENFTFINLTRVVAKSEALTKEETINWLKKYEHVEEVPELIALVKNNCFNIDFDKKQLPASTKQILSDNLVHVNETPIKKSNKQFIIDEVNKKPMHISQSEINRIINKEVHKYGQSVNTGTHLKALGDIKALIDKIPEGSYQNRVYKAAYETLDSWIDAVE